MHLVGAVAKEILAEIDDDGGRAQAKFPGRIEEGLTDGHGEDFPAPFPQNILYNRYFRSHHVGGRIPFPT